MSLLRLATSVSAKNGLMAKPFSRPTAFLVGCLLALTLWAPLTARAQGTPPGGYSSSGSGGGGTNFGTTTVVVTGGANGLSGTSGFGTTANTRYFVTANDTESAAITWSASNSSIECAPGVTIQFTGATNGFNVSGNQNRFGPCIWDHNSQTGAGTGPLFNITGNDNFVTGFFQNTGTTNPATATWYTTAGQHNTIDHATFLGSTSDSAVGIVPAASTTVQDDVVSFLQVPSFAPAGVLYAIFWSCQASGAKCPRLHIVDNNIRLNSGFAGGIASFNAAAEAKSCPFGCH